MEEDQPCLHPAQRKGQGPETLCHWFSSCQSSVQFSFSPDVLAQSLFLPMLSPGSAAAPGPVGTTERQHANDQSPGELPSDRPLLSLDYIILGFQTDQSLSQSFLGPRPNQSTPYIFPGLVRGPPPNQSGLFPRLDTAPLWSPSWILLRMFPAEDFSVNVSSLPG